LTPPAREAHYSRVRKLFPQRDHPFKPGVIRPKLPGYLLAFLLLITTARANPQLDVTNPTSFFTNVAAALFQQLDLHDFNGNLVTVTNIPIYQDPTLYGGTNINYYTPAVHRILQLAANLFDATTNRFIGDGPTNYPTVFRPLFASHNGIAAIIGYEEVTNSSVAFLPTLFPSDFVKLDQSLNTIINMRGVPWVIGAKKGFPNFNQYSMENDLNISRKLQFTNATALPPWTTNQVYGINLTNLFGVGAWNSYTNDYGRPLHLVVSNAVSFMITNENSFFPILVVSNLSFGSDTLYATWPGWTRQKSDASFQVPLNVSRVYTNGLYQQRSPQFIPLVPPIYSVTFSPRMWLSVQLDLKYVLIDTSVDRVVDFVNVSSTQPSIDLTTLLNNGYSGQFTDISTLDGQWSTNLLSGISIGILNQIQVSYGGSSSIWTAPNKTIQASHFRTLLLNGGTNSFQAPYTPSRTIFQRISWEANDPLVHYTTSDLTSTNGVQSLYNMVGLVVSGPPLAGLASLNYAYQPWGGYHLPNGASIFPTIVDYDVRVKDPDIQQSDDWDFPSGQSLSFAWLGRVHRGTPWQTVFLKSSTQPLGQWLAWNNDNIFFTNGFYIVSDAALSLPTNDWRLASAWVQWVNTNDLASLLSINNPDPDAWAARLDGLTALTNSGSAGLVTLPIASNSPPAGFIAQAIQNARANTSPALGPIFANHVFSTPGDLLATPELSIASPFLNLAGMTQSPSANGITDAAMEALPTQLLPLLRADSIGQIIPANGQLQLSFSGYDGHAYAIETSSNLIDWSPISTNSPTDGKFTTTNAAPTDQQFFRSILLQ